MIFSLHRRVAAEAFGTCLLVATVVGSGIMAEQLAGGNAALALLGNTLPTGAMLVVLILALGPISGAHFNPAVSLVAAIRGAIARHEALAYIAVQIVGGCLGTLIAHAMFEVPLFQISETVRSGPGQWLAEFVATFGLIVTIDTVSRQGSRDVALAVGLYIAAAYWFTASTSFANPAVTLARSLTASFSGIAPASAPMFILAQCTGALAGLALTAWLVGPGPDAAEFDAR